MIQHAAGDTYERALAMLDRRSYASAELRRRLAQRGHPPAAIDAAVARLVAAGLLDDVAYARQFTRAKLTDGGMAPLRVRRELARRGVDRAVVDAALADVVSEEGIDRVATLEHLARRRLGALTACDDRTRRRRLAAYLARRGYATDEIIRTVNHLLDRGR